MVLRQPLTQTRWQQQLLIPVARDEVLRHPESLLNPPDSRAFVRHPRREALVAIRDELVLLSTRGYSRLCRLRRSGHRSKRTAGTSRQRHAGSEGAGRCVGHTTARPRVAAPWRLNGVACAIA